MHKDRLGFQCRDNEDVQADRITALEAQLATAQRELAEMTTDRNLWRDDHGDDCPYKEQLAEARRLAQWTPITPDTMPPPEENVMVYRSGVIYTAHHDGGSYPIKCWWIPGNGAANLNDFTHWQPLPAPPEVKP